VARVGGVPALTFFARFIGMFCIRAATVQNAGAGPVDARQDGGFRKGGLW
jgi:hypothetical protein